MSNNNWTMVTLGEVSSEETTRLGKSITNYPIYGVDRSVGLTTTPKYVGKSLSRYKRLLPGMFAYNPMRLNIGSIGYCSKKHEAGLVSPDYVVFSCDESRLDPEFLSHYIKSFFWRNWTEGSGIGSVRVRIYYDELSQMPIELPPISEQRAIARILGTLEEKITLNRQINETLESITQSIFKSWFIDYDPVRAKTEGCDSCLSKDISDLFPDSFENSEFGHIPKGWEIKKIGDILNRLPASVTYNKDQVEPDGKTPVFEQGAGVLLGYHNETAQISATHDDPAFIFGDHTCVTRLSCEPFDVSQNVIPLKGSDRSTFWVYYAVRDKQTFQEYRRHWMELIYKEVVVPKPDICETFSRIASPIQMRIEANLRQSQTIALIRDTLLPQLMSGQIRVR